MYDNDMIMSLKQKKITLKPRIKLNHNNALFNRSVDRYQLIQVTSTQVVSIV